MRSDVGRPSSIENQILAESSLHRRRPLGWYCGRLVIFTVYSWYQYSDICQCIRVLAAADFIESLKPCPTSGEGLTQIFTIPCKADFWPFPRKCIVRLEDSINVRRDPNTLQGVYDLDYFISRKVRWERRQLEWWNCGSCADGETFISILGKIREGQSSHESS